MVGLAGCREKETGNYWGWGCFLYLHIISFTSSYSFFLLSLSPTYFLYLYP